MFHSLDLFKALILLLSIPVLLFGSEDDLLFQPKYESMLNAIQQGEFGEAIAFARDLVSLTPTSPIGYNSRYILGVLYYRQQEWKKASDQFEYIINKGKKDKLYWYSLYYRANSLFHQKKYLPSAKGFIPLLTGHTVPKLVSENSWKSFDRLLWGYLTLEELKLLKASYIGTVIEQRAWYFYIKRLLRSNRDFVALEQLRDFLREYPEGELTEELRQIAQELEGEIESNLVVALLLPFTGDYGVYGNDIYRGIKLAFQDFQTVKGRKIILKRLDTTGDPLATSLVLKSFLSSSQPVAIIGPLKSECAVVANLIAEENGIPIITPTANREGLAEMSELAFQLSTSLEKKTSFLAVYAHQELNCSTFAVIAPDDEYGRRAGHKFSATVLEEGAQLVGSSYYPLGTVDFTPILNSLKEPLLEEMKEQADTSDSSNPIFYDEKGEKRPPEEWLVQIDGFFVPTYPEDLPTIIPQIPFNYVETRFLGALGWSEKSLKSDFLEYVDSAVYVADEFYIDQSEPAWRMFKKQYLEKYGYLGGSPTRFAALGYDAGGIISKGIKSGALTPRLMHKYLKEIGEYNGAAGKIIFDEEGANSFVPLLMVKRERVVRIK